MKRTKSVFLVISFFFSCIATPLVALLLIFALAPIALSAQGAAKKIALVIGNSAYSTGRLRNPVNDATDVARALRAIGFTVALGTDTNKKTMYELVDQFDSDIRSAGIALFYYSGHGVQVAGENYLIPVGSDIARASDIETEAFPLQRLIGRMNDGGAGTNVIILDACRNNPFPQATKGMERGLAAVGQKPPESVIVYATEAGETADDGPGRNGVFTAALLRNIGRNEEFTVVLRDVNAEVRGVTNQKQKPANYQNLTHGVFLAGMGGASVLIPSDPLIELQRQLETLQGEYAAEQASARARRLWGWIGLAATASLGAYGYFDGHYAYIEYKSAIAPDVINSSRNRLTLDAALLVGSAFAGALDLLLFIPPSDAIQQEIKMLELKMRLRNQ